MEDRAFARAKESIERQRLDELPMTPMVKTVMETMAEVMLRQRERRAIEMSNGRPG